MCKLLIFMGLFIALSYALPVTDEPEEPINDDQATLSLIYKKFHLKDHEFIENLNENAEIPIKFRYIYNMGASKTVDYPAKPSTEVDCSPELNSPPLYGTITLYVDSINKTYPVTINTEGEITRAIYEDKLNAEDQADFDYLANNFQYLDGAFKFGGKTDRNLHFDFEHQVTKNYEIAYPTKESNSDSCAKIYLPSSGSIILENGKSYDSWIDENGDLLAGYPPAHFPSACLASLSGCGINGK